MTLTLSPWLYAPTLVVAGLGAFMLYAALLRDRLRATLTRRRCPKCWYDLSGSSGLTCPECGHAARDDRELRRSRMRPLIACVGALLVAPLLVLFGVRDARKVYYAVMPTYYTAESGSRPGVSWTLERVRDPTALRNDRFTLRGRSNVLLDVEDQWITLGEQYFGSTDSRTLAPIQDFNNDGVLELTVIAYSGGAHCCYTAFIIELSDPPNVAAVIDARNGLGGVSVNGEILLNISDQTFDYWNAPHAGSPFPSVFYRLRNHRLEVALERMTPEVLLKLDDPIDLEAQPAAIRASMTPAASPLNPLMWAGMLDRLYAGQTEDAWVFFDACWPPSRPGKDEFKAEFLEQLNLSTQWQDVQAARAAAARGEPLPAAQVGVPPTGPVQEP